MRKYVYPTIEHVQEVTDFKDKNVAKAAIETLMWLDEGAPHKFDGLPGKFVFNMSQYIKAIDKNGLMWGNPCGTACCLAGAMKMYMDKGNEDFRTHNSYHLNEEFDINSNKDAAGHEPLRQLFYGGNFDAYLDVITPFEAAITLRKYLKTGIVDWSHLDKEKLGNRGLRSMKIK